MEAMKELLKQYQSDIADIRKTQFSYAYKALSDPDINTDEVNRDELVEKIMSMDLSRFGMFQQMFQGLAGGGTGGGAQDFLQPKTAAKTPDYRSETATRAPVGVLGMGDYYKSSAARAPARAPVGKPMQAAAPKKDRFTIGQVHKGYRYIGNDQWQKI